MPTIIRIDEKGRLLIPKDIREKTSLKNGSYVSVKIEEGKIIIEPIESVADKYFGAFKVTKWPKDLDEFISEVMKKWWTA